jgi:TRAP-type mannitol/chloroaromatic compound transport system substrate-binding protein
MMRHLVAFVTAGVLLSGPAFAQQKHSFTMTTTVPEGSILYTAMTVPYVEAVKSLCGDQVEIKPFGAGVLARFSEGHLAVQDGRADTAHTTPIWLVNQDAANAPLGSLPGGLGAEAMLIWIYKEGGRDLWVKFRREKMGLHTIIAGMGTTEIFAHSHKAIRTLADLQGLKIRSSGAWADILKGLGATPVVLGGGDIFPMLERRGIDAAEWLNPSGNVSTGLANISKYVITPGMHSTSWPYEVVFKADVFDKLPKPVQACLEQAGELVTMRSYLFFGQQDLKAMAQFRQKNEIIELDQSVIDEVKKRARSWMHDKAEEQASKGNNWGKEIAASYFAFQDSWDANSGYRAR